jgi:UDP-N-acetylmuramoyl-L-alanyl-D-glutamate--2,6-diaminopimelate ligase
MMFYDLLKVAGVRQKISCANFNVTDIVQDSRLVRAGSIFVAIKGSKLDGHDYIANAIKNGARMILAERALAFDASVPVLQIKNVRETYAIMHHEISGKPSLDLKLIGVTGTNGKTTTAFLIQTLLSSMRQTGLIGTMGCRFGSRFEESTHTTPDAAQVHRILLQMKESGCDACVMEASSHALDQDRLAGLSFDAAVFSNLTHDHLDYHKTPEAYLAAKAKLFESLASNGTAVLNADDPASGKIKIPRGRVLTFGTHHPADFRAEEIHMDLMGTTFVLPYQNQRFFFETNLIGRHNVSNILGALAVATSFKVPMSDCQRSLRQFKGVKGRLERLEAGQNFELFVDYAHTEDGLHHVLQTLKPHVKGRLLVLFGCGGDRDLDKRPKMAQVAERYADFVMITSDNPRTENPKKILRDIAAGFTQGRCEVQSQEDRSKAIRQILLKARKGDGVLLAGKGHETVQWIGEKSIAFSDQLEALKILAGK